MCDVNMCDVSAKVAAERRRPSDARAYIRPLAVQQVQRLPRKSSGRAVETKRRQSVQTSDPLQRSKPHACHAKAAAKRRCVMSVCMKNLCDVKRCHCVCDVKLCDVSVCVCVWCEVVWCQCCVVLCCVVLCCVVLCCAVLCCAVLCCAVLCCAVLCCAVLCCAVLCCAVLCCAVLCCAVLCCAVLCCAVLCCAVLCCAVLCWAGLGWAGLGWAVLCCAVLGWAGLGWAGLGWAGLGCGVVWCGVVWCGVVWCGVVWCGVVWCGVVWCGVVWCGVVWCGVVWCGVLCCVVLCCVVLCCVVLCCVWLCVCERRKRGKEGRKDSHKQKTRTPHINVGKKTRDKWRSYTTWHLPWGEILPHQPAMPASGWDDRMPAADAVRSAPAGSLQAITVASTGKNVAEILFFLEVSVRYYVNNDQSCVKWLQWLGWLNSSRITQSKVRLDQLRGLLCGDWLRDYLPISIWRRAGSWSLFFPQAKSKFWSQVVGMHYPVK